MSYQASVIVSYCQFFSVIVSFFVMFHNLTLSHISMPSVIFIVPILSYLFLLYIQFLSSVGLIYFNVVEVNETEMPLARISENSQEYLQPKIGSTWAVYYVICCKR